MKPTRRHIALGLAVISIALAFGIVRLRESSFLSVSPLPTSPRILKAMQVENLLTSDLHVVRTVQEIPAEVKKGFSSIVHEQFEMANPGQMMSGDAIQQGVPNKRLVFAAFSNRIAVVVFEQGGYVTTRQVFVLDHQDEGGVFVATLDGYSVNNLSTLREAIGSNNFTIWGDSREPK